MDAECLSLQKAASCKAGIAVFLITWELEAEPHSVTDKLAALVLLLILPLHTALKAKSEVTSDYVVLIFSMISLITSSFCCALVCS